MSNARGRTVALVLAALLSVGSLPLLATTPAAAVVPVDSPTGLTPADNEDVQGNPQFGWDPPADAVRHRIQVSTSPTYSSTLVNEITYNTTYTPSVELPTGELYWRVAGMEASGSAQGPYAESTFVKGLPAPTALAPAPGDTLDFPSNAPTFTWTATPVAKSYVLEVDDAADFIGAKKFVTANTGYTPIDPLASGPAPGKPYYWRVRGSSNASGTGVLTDWSQVRSFNVTWSATVNMVKPATNEHVTDIEFVWDSVPGATAYNLQADLDEVFTSPVVLDAKNLHSNRYSYRLALPNAAYWWRVQPIDAKGNQGEWSAPRQFTREWLSPPTLLAPAAEANTSGDLRFQWSPVDHASRYQIQFASDVNFSLNLDNCFTLQTSAYDGAGCSSVSTQYTGGDFYWRVRGVDDPAPPGIIGVWSETRHHDGHTRPAVSGTFNAATPVSTLTPQASCPGGGICTFRAAPTFSWQAAPGATSYRLHIARDPNFTTPAIVSPGYISIVAPQKAFVPLDEIPDTDAGQSYYWYVQPCATVCGPDPVGAFPPVASNQFRKNSASVELLSPADGGSQQYVPRFEWKDYLLTTSTDAADPAPGTTDMEALSYQIQVSTVPSFATLVDDKTVDQTFFTPWDRTYPEGPLYWRVRALDGDTPPHYLSWSEDVGSPAHPRMFTLHSPKVVQSAPLNNATVQGVPTFSWQSLPHSAAYHFEVYKNGDTNYSTPNRVVDVTTAHTEFTPQIAFAPGSYTWRIRRKDADSRFGVWSHEAGDTARTFTIGTGTGPTLVAPIDNKVVGDDMVFVWNPVARAATYRFQRSTSSNFATVTQKDTVMTAWAPPEKVAQGRWYWRVIALDAAGNVLTTSATRSVVRDVLPSAPTNVVGYPDDAAVTLAWSAPASSGGSAITGYVITPYIGAAAQASVNVPTATPTTFAVTGLSNGTAYTFRVAAKISGGTGPQSAASAPVTPIPAAPGTVKSVYVPITPCRVVDTRSKGGAFAPNQQRQYQVAGGGTQFANQGGKAGGCLIPDGATAVEASVTAVSPSTNGFFRAWPAGQGTPNATFLNYSKGKNITNTGAIALAPTGLLDLAVQNYAATAQYVIDVQGYFVAPAAVPAGATGSVYIPISPCRVVDTRGKVGAFTNNQKRDYQVGGTGTAFAAQGGKDGGCGVPDDASAVEASVTAVAPKANGYFRAWPTGEAAPNATFLNFTKGQGITNTGAIKLAPTGSKDLSVQNYSSGSHYVIDIQGYFVTVDKIPAGKVGSKFVAVSPCRVVDTRQGSGAFVTNEQRMLQVGGTGSNFAAQGGKADGCGVPDGAAAVEASVTAVSPAATGYFRAWPAGQAAPNATFLNFTKAQNVTNTGAITLAAAGVTDLAVQNYSTGSHYVIDVQGYYRP